MATYKTVRKNNEEVGQELRRHIINVYGGSIAGYCSANKIDYSGFMKAVSGLREFSDQMAAPLLWTKKTESFFVKQVTVEV